jgi:uncharacterized protein (DUF736 family)
MNKEDELGALWAKQTKNGEEYFSGTINGQRVVVFANRYWDSEQKPKWKVYKAREREQV